MQTTAPKIVNRPAAQPAAPAKTPGAGSPAQAAPLRSPHLAGMAGLIVQRQPPQEAPRPGQYLTRSGQWVELPPGMGAGEAARLEGEGMAAERQLGKTPPPKPVPEADKPARPAPKKEKPKPAAEAGRAAPGRAAPPKAPAAGPAPPAAGSPLAQYLAAQGAPALRRGRGMLQKLRENEQTHADAAEKLGQSEKAVAIPPSEGQSKSNAGQIDAVGARPAPAVDEKRARQKFQESLEAGVPTSIEALDNFKRDGKARHIGADVMAVVQGDKQAVTSTFADMEHTPEASPPERQPEALPPEEAAPPTPAINLGQGAVAPPRPEHTDTGQYTREADAKLKEEGVTQEQLDMVDSGELADANKEKKGLEQAAKAGPAAAQAFARQQAERVDGELRREEQAARDGLKARRKAALGATGQKQRQTKAAQEAKRLEVATHINALHTTAQDSIKKKLSDLETRSMKRFKEGSDKAAREFEDRVKQELDAFKARRYSGFWGSLKRAKDWLLGMDELPEVQAIFDSNKAAFSKAIGQLVADITADQQRTIAECRTELAEAKKGIQTYVNTLGPGLRAIGNKSAEEMGSKLGELDAFVNQREQDLAQQLKDKQGEAIKAIDEKIKSMKESMSGALSKLGRLLLMAAKKFFTWALQKAGYSLEEIEGIINRGVAVLKAIFTQPIQFVKNLVNAAITGFKNFGKNFLTHLKNALFEWLTGSLEGLVLPQTWDFKGIVGVALQMIGISYQNIRKHLVDVMGATVVDGLEKTFALLKTLITEGPMAAWEQLKEMAAEMRDAFIEAVKDFIKMKIIEEAIKFVAAIFIPGAGIIKAIIAIYDTVVFFIKKAKQIAQMIGSFLSSIGEIAMGNIGAAADALEKGLARGLTLVISFLAQLLHLTGITNKIRDAIQKIRGKVDAALAKVAKWIADKAKQLFGAVKAGVAKAVAWWKAKKPFKTKSGEGHTIYYAGEEKNAVPMVASKDPQPIERKLDEFRDMAASPDASKDRKKGLGLIDKTRKLLKQNPDDPAIVSNMTELFNIFEEEGPLKETDYQQKSDRLPGDPTEVGVYMRINWLSHTWIEKHPGSPPGSGQDSLMDKLVVDPKQRSSFKYIRGHLLNENLGGKGENKNLFPITANANSQHLKSTEKDIKNWVLPGDKKKTPRKYALYEVKVEVKDVQLKARNIANNYVDAMFHCRVSLKDESGEEKKSFLSSIESIYEKKREASRFDLLEEKK